MASDKVQIKGFVTIPPEGSWLSRISLEYPDIQVSIVSMLPVGPSGGNILIIFKGIDVSKRVSELKPGGGIVSCTILHDEKNKILANLRIDSARILHAIMEFEVPIRYPIKLTPGKATADFITERWRIDELITKLNEIGFPVEIQRIGPVKTAHLLTETQANILNIALKKKYFDIPRGIKLQELASEVGIGASALSERLRRIFKKLSLNYVLDDDS